MTEELALDEGGGESGAVHLDEDAIAPGALRVDRLSHQLLTCPRFAQDEHGGVRGRHPLHLEQDAPQGDALADDVLESLGGEDVLAEILVLCLETLVQRLDLCESRAQRPLVLSAQEGTGEDFAHEAQAVDERLRPRALCAHGAEREHAEESAPALDRKDGGGLLAKPAPRPPIAGRLRREIAGSGEDERDARVNNLSPEPGEIELRGAEWT